MASPEHLEIVKQGAGAIAAWRKAHPDTQLDLVDADLSKADLRRADLRNANLSHADLRDANLNDAILSHANLIETNFNNANLIKAELSEADLREATLIKAQLNEANLNRANLSQAHLSNAVLNKADIRDAVLTGASLVGAMLQGADLRKANLNKTGLSDANFNKANLGNANLRGTTVDSGTDFLDANVDGAAIDKHTLESLKDYGRLTRGDRMKMNIVDDVATLRAAYSGFMQWLHLIALVVFVFPYAWFVVKHWAVARFVTATTEQTIPFWKAIFRFIWNGGNNWQEGWDLSVLSFSMFMIASVYNILRLVLLWKTKRLELRQEASGLPVIFSLTGSWKWIYWAATRGLYINLAVVALHTWHFLTQEIPITVGVTTTGP